MIYSGTDGAVKIVSGENTTLVEHLSSFELEISAESIEDIAFGSELKDRVSGMKDWNISFDGSAEFGSSKQVDIINALFAGSEVTLGIYLDTDIYFQGDSIIESISVSDEADGKAEISFKASGCGALTKAIAG